MICHSMHRCLIQLRHRIPNQFQFSLEARFNRILEQNGVSPGMHNESVNTPNLIRLKWQNARHTGRGIHETWVQASRRRWPSHTMVFAAQSRRRTQIILRACPPGRVNVHTRWANLLRLVWFLSAHRRITVRSFGT